MCPAHLRTANRRIRKVINELAQKVRPGHKVSVENCNQFAFSTFQAILERARFKTCSVVAMNVVNVETGTGVSAYRRAGYRSGFISRIVEYLNFQTLTRVIHRGDSLDKPLDHVHFVKERKLYSNMRQLVFCESCFRFWRESSIAPEFRYLLNTIHSIDRQDSQNAEIDNQDRPIKRIELIKRANIRKRFVIPFTHPGRIDAQVSRDRMSDYRVGC